MHTRLRPLAHRGFTLIELLVVISIIAILAAIAFPVATGALTSAKRVQTAALANGIQTGIIAYETEYGTYPASGAETALTGDAAGPVIIVLHGNRNPNNPSTTSDTGFNTRNIAFISLKPEQVDSSTGAALAPLAGNDTDRKLSIIMDTDYNNYITPISGTDVGEGSAVWLPETTRLTGSSPMIGTFRVAQ